MGWIRAVGPLALVLIASVGATAGVAQASSQSVQTPAETLHVTYHWSIEDPETRGEMFCFPDLGCFVLDPVHVDDLGAVGGGVGLWVEDNGCDGLQRSAGDCDEDGDTEDPDSRIASEDRRVDL